MRVSSKENQYQGYLNFKRWDKEPSRADEFVGIFPTLTTAMSYKILEIGFGPGYFLDWARERGHLVWGVEILSEAIDAARKRGHNVCSWHEWDSIPGPFDMIVALDVLEHVEPLKLLELLKKLKGALTESGKVIIKVPNGESPFAGKYLYGDMTHERPLTSESLRQIAQTCNFKLDAVYNARAQPKGLKRRFVKFFIHLIRDVIEVAIGYLYFGCRSPLDPSIVVIFTQKAKGMI